MLRCTKHYTQNYRSSNTDPTKYQRRTGAPMYKTLHTKLQIVLTDTKYQRRTGAPMYKPLHTKLSCREANRCSDVQNTTHKTTDRATQTPLNIRDEQVLRCTKYYTQNYRSCNTDPTKYQRRTGAPMYKTLHTKLQIV